jgi:hypothetical protein
MNNSNSITKIIVLKVSTLPRYSNFKWKKKVLNRKFRSWLGKFCDDANWASLQRKVHLRFETSFCSSQQKVLNCRDIWDSESHSDPREVAPSQVTIFIISLMLLMEICCDIWQALLRLASQTHKNYIIGFLLYSRLMQPLHPNQNLDFSPFPALLQRSGCNCRPRLRISNLVFSFISLRKLEWWKRKNSLISISFKSLS